MTRVGTCEREGCNQRFVDTSRAQRRRFCSDTCRKLQNAGNPRCEVCGVSLSWGGGHKPVPTTCHQHNKGSRFLHDLGAQRTRKAYALRKSGLNNVEIAERLGDSAVAIRNLLTAKRVEALGLPYIPSPYRGGAMRAGRWPKAA